MSFWSVLPLAGAQLYGSRLNYRAQQAQGQMQYQVAQQNLAEERANREQMLSLQREAWEREDNAVARRVADLKASGLSPVLAAGSAASTMSPIRTDAPQMDDTFAHTIGRRGEILGETLPGVMGIVSQAMALNQQEQTIAKTKAEKDAIVLQSLRNEVGLDIDRHRLGMMPDERELLKAKVGLSMVEKDVRREAIVRSMLSRELDQYNLDQSRKLGMRTNDPTSMWGIGTGIMREMLDKAALPSAKSSGRSMDDVVRGLTDQVQQGKTRASTPWWRRWKSR